MKKMKFRLEHVLRLREFEEKKAKLELGLVLGKINGLNFEIDEAKKQMQKSNNEFNQYLKETRKVQDIKIFPFLIEDLQRIIDKKKQDLLILKKELEVKKNILKVAETKFKILEKLKENQLERFKKEENKKLINELDDNTIMRYEEEK